MTSYNWHRRKISPAEYGKLMDIPSGNDVKSEFTVSVNKGDNDCYTVKVEQDLLDALTAPSGCRRTLSPQTYGSSR